MGGEKEYHSYIGSLLETLVPIKQVCDQSGTYDHMSKEQREIEFKKAVISELVFDSYTDKNEQIFYIGVYELVLDIFEF